MIEQTNFVRSYLFLLDNMIGDQPDNWRRLLKGLKQISNFLEFLGKDSNYTRYTYRKQKAEVLKL